MLGPTDTAVLAALTPLLVTLGVLAALALYLGPSLIAFGREHHQRGAIVIVNLFLGWTILGWVICLALSCTRVIPPVVAPPDWSLRLPTPAPLPVRRRALESRTR